MFTVKVTKPKTLKTLWSELENLPENRKYLAGGTDICAVANTHGCAYEELIDISDLEELKGINLENGVLKIGGGEKISALEESELVKKHLPAFHACFLSYASPSLRNMATLGGNIANASPSGDAICGLIAEGAEIVIVNGDKEKRHKLEEIFTGPKKTILAKDDIILRVEIPVSEHKGQYYKLANRKLFAISKVNVAVCAWFKDGVISEIKIVLGAVAPTVIRAVKAENAIKGKALTESVISAACAAAVGEISPIDDVRSTAEYRKNVAGVMLKRCLQKLV